MTRDALRAIRIVLWREYVHRVRSRSFVLATIMTPVLLLAFAALPPLLAAPHLMQHRHMVIACTDRELARRLQKWFTENSYLGHYTVELDPATSNDEHERLLARLRAVQVDGFLWIDDAAIASGRVSYTSREHTDLFEKEYLRSTLAWNITRERLALRGIAPMDVARLLSPVRLDAVALDQRPGSRGTDTAGLIVIAFLVLGLETSLLSYGVMVMRSVLDDKSSRVMEVLLCAATPRELMAGKILGVGMVSLTQVAAWLVMAATALILGASAANARTALTLPIGSLLVFAMFYVLGYLLYSSLFAAVGAAFNSIDEAQHWNFLITMPLLISGLMAWTAAGMPPSTLFTIVSFIPPFTPVLMSMRIALGQAPAWQVGLSLALLLGSIYFALVISARIYRVGILMYGKKPTVREIARWLRFA